MSAGSRPGELSRLSGDLGTDCIDYILVDSFVVQANEQPNFVEQLVHLPGCYQVNDRRREIASAAPSRTACGLPREGLMFCSFNNSYKITAAFFDIRYLVRLLATVPGSMLWLLEPNDLVRHNLRREAERRGISPDRLVFAPLVPLPDHFSRRASSRSPSRH